MKISKIEMQKNIKLQPVPPSMPLEALLTPDNLTYNAFVNLPNIRNTYPNVMLRQWIDEYSP